MGHRQGRTDSTDGSLVSVRLDPQGMKRLAQSAGIRKAVERAAEAVAENVRSQNHRVEGIPGDVELPVRVSVYETDRARASVTLAHPSGMAVQAKHGALTRAASEIGLEVRGD